MVFLILLDSLNIEFGVDSEWIDLLKSLLITVYVAYFGSRGVEKFKSICKHSNAIFMDQNLPSSNEMGILAENKYQNNEFEDVAYFEPYYLKDFYTMFTDNQILDIYDEFKFVDTRSRKNTILFPSSFIKSVSLIKNCPIVFKDEGSKRVILYEPG